MDRYYTQTIGVPVHTTSGGQAGRVIEIVIDPETGKIAGFLLSPRGQYVVAPSDIVFWDEHLFIHDEDDILETDEILKVQEILKKNIPIFGNKVYTKSGKYMGKVYDIGIHPKFFTLTKLAVAKNILGLFPYEEKLISFSDIVEITHDKVTIKDSDAKITEKEKSKDKDKLRIDIVAPSTFREN